MISGESRGTKRIEDLLSSTNRQAVDIAFDKKIVMTGPRIFLQHDTDGVKALYRSDSF